MASSDSKSAAAVGSAARGRAAESIAAQWLRLRGLDLLDHNRRGRGGEIDLIARDGDFLVFVEVRMRDASAWVGAASSIGVEKVRRLRSCARHLLATREDLRWARRRLRFDVVELTLRGPRLELRHLVSVDLGRRRT